MKWPQFNLGIMVDMVYYKTRNLYKTPGSPKKYFWKYYIQIEN